MSTKNKVVELKDVLIPVSREDIMNKPRNFVAEMSFRDAGMESEQSFPTKMRKNSKMSFYTGVGSRNTPKEILTLMHKIAYNLAENGYILRSGAAEGADMAFELGCFTAGGGKEVYIPWNGFNDKLIDCDDVFVGPRLDKWKEAEQIASQTHPAWGRLSKGAKALHTRNVFQVLGKDLNTPSKFLVCWAETNKEDVPKGGTRTAYVLAQKHSIPCFNLYKEEDYNRISKWTNRGG